MLSDLKHPNIVSIVGFCDEQHEKIIVTTYEAKNGSLKEHLSNPNLTWTQRLKISVDVARALSYLHYNEGRGYGVIHLNINSSTILLDENWEPKLSGFKVSIKQSLNRMNQVILSEPIGTIGYVDPEIEKTKGVTYKSDIYSFGVVLFEILCGRKAFVPNDANRLLAPLAIYHYEKKMLKEIIHPALWNQMSPHSLKRYSKVAYSCINGERRNRMDTNNIVNELEDFQLQQVQRLNLIENLKHLKIHLSGIKLATDDFSDTYKIGVTAYCNLYRATFDFEKTSPIEAMNKGEPLKRHNIVLIKRILSRDDEQGEGVFFTELEMLTSVKHHNIITLLGFCVEGSEMILVTENVSNRFLGDHLGNVNDMRILTWEKRLKICIDVAHALNYLHSEMEAQKIVINRDIKSDNIGLDENLRAKIVEFGFSVFLPPNQNGEALHLTNIAGSYYYIDPEYEKSGTLKRESDVYSFGVILFEILCGRLAYDPIYVNEGDKGLVSVARQSYNTGTLENIIDHIIMEEIGESSFIPNKGPNKGSLEIYIEIANRCVAATQAERPTMKVVVKELEKALFIQMSQGDQVQGSETDHAVSKLEKTLELQLNEENNHEEQTQRPNTTQVIAKPKEALELQSTHEILVGKNLEHLKIPLTHIQSATHYFSQEYKIVNFPEEDYAFYRAELEHYDKENPSSKRHNTVLIKRYPPSGNQWYGEKEFLTEIEILSGGVKHPNIVNMLGFCFEESEMILVIDNFSNGFLGEYLVNLKDKRVLTWENRLKICIDVAHALRYIHYEMEDQKMIINHDIYRYNIGLDENFEAKIVNFWWSVFLPPNQEDEALYLNNGICRLCYIDPEYEKTHKLKKESDVYGFGVVLFEILCGKLADDPIYLKESDIGLAHVARRSFSTRSLEEMIDPVIKEEIGENKFVLNRGPNKDSLHTFITIAHQCVAETQDQRPTMKIIVKELEKALFFQNNNKDNPKMSLEEIKRVTQNFHDDNFIGGGGFGKVYKGNLHDGDGIKTIVAKRLDTRFGQGEQQFFSELQILLEYNHENVVRLVGYCDETDEKVLIYEYLSKGSLDRYLNDTSLTWVKRLNICIDIARALDFLHEGVGKQAKVIHRDIKTENILLNNDWKAKLADFGLSLICSINQETDYIIDHACGTRGYVDPLYRQSGFLTIESDIYSFGVVLFEILCGRSTFAIHKHEGHYLPDFIKNKFEEGKHAEVVFEQIREQIVPQSLTTFQEVAYQCLHLEREKRPTTKKVLVELQKALEFQLNSEVSIIETQVVELSSELNDMTMTGKSENSEIRNKEKMLLDQTDDQAESDCCKKVKTLRKAATPCRLSIS
uniref:non-specific serine/threonine protein kinase n=1 Tax=Helianthus annuus TaxID=4232 RepID=A0A251THK1_HELAN